MHLIPIIITLAVLQLSFRTVYWSDLEELSSAQNSILNTLQIVAKIHEICIVASLSEIVLHKIRWDLTGKEGVPFGLVTSGYQISSITYLWSWQFWGGIFENDLRRSYSRRIRLFILVTLASVTAVLVGPASAVSIIPRLDVWDVSFPYLGSATTFIPNSTAELWPTSLTSDFIVKPDCYEPEASRHRYCPSVGIPTILGWDPKNWRVNPNITMPISNTGMVRYLASSKINKHYSGITVSSTVSDLMARDLGCAWGESVYHTPVSMNRPIVEEILGEQNPLQKPAVAVSCQMYNVNTLADMRFPNLGQAIRVPSETWNTSAAVSDSTKLSWVDMWPFGSLGTVLVVTVQGNNVKRYRMVVPCVIDARSIPVRMWIDPLKDNSIHDDHPDIVSLSSSPQQKSLLKKARRIHIHPGWAEAVNVRLSGSNQTSLEQLVSTYLSQTDYHPANDKELERRAGLVNNHLDHWAELETTFLGVSLDNLNSHLLEGRNSGDWVVHRYTGPSYPDLISYALSLSLADALARIRSEIRSYYVTPPLAPVLNQNSRIGTVLCTSIIETWFGQGRNMSGPNWTSLKFSVKRFGYGWGLNSTPIKLAAAVLLLNVFICLAHIASVVYGGWTSPLLRTMGEFIALATNSKPTDKLRNTCAGIDKMRTWQKTMSIRQIGDQHLELVFADGSDEEEIGEIPIPNKRYGALQRAGQRLSHVE